MILSPTLTRYLTKVALLNFLAMLGVLLGIVYLFETVELLRRAGKQESVPLSVVLRMALFKLPEVGQTLLPFAVLFSAMLSFWQLNRRSELIVIRAAGFSVWQFLSPMVGVAVFLGVLNITVLNPFGAVLLSRYEALEREYMGRQEEFVTLFREGLWLRQPHETGYVILHARTLRVPAWTLEGTMLLYFDPEGGLMRRVDAPDARLEEGRWVFDSARLHGTGASSHVVQTLILPTRLSRQDIEESFSSPRTISFWNLPTFIRTLEETGFDARRLHIYFQNLLAQPLLFTAMILLAGIVSIRPPRQRGATLLVLGGIFAGFLVFFAGSYLQALGASYQIPPFLAAWSAPLVTFLLGVALMLGLEDG